MSTFLRYIYCIFIGGFALVPYFVFAQLSLIEPSSQSTLSSTQAFHVTWKSEVYVPPSYYGKALATTRSPLTVAFEITDGDRLLDVNKKEIRWFIKNTLIQKGIGLQRVRIIPQNNTDDDITLRIDVMDFNGGVLRYSYTIPTTHPRLVIDAPYVLDALSKLSYTFTALPFFFTIRNLSDLHFTWEVRGKETQGLVDAPHVLELQIVPGMNNSLVLQARATNAHDQLEFTSERLELFIP